MIFDIIKFYKIKCLRLIFCFLAINSVAYSWEQRKDLWFSHAIINQKIIEFKGVFAKAERKELIQYDFSLVEVEKFPPYLLYYVNSRMQFIHSCWSLDDFKKSQKILSVKRGSQNIYQVLKLPTVAILKALPLDFDFDIKYKKIKETKGERLPLTLNYLAREFETTEGFEAGETLFGSYQLTPRMRVISRIGFFEKWVTQKELYEEMHHIELTPEKTGGDIQQFTGTLKYALGGTWDIYLKNKRKMSFEFLMQQKTHNQWHVQQMMLKETRASGVLFDHWVFTLQFNF